MAFKMNKDGFTFYTKEGLTMRDEGYPKYNHDKGPTFNQKLRDEALDPNTTMNEGFKEKVLSSNTMKTPYYKHGGTKPQSQMTEDELAEHKGIKKPQTTKPSQNDEPAYPGGDITQREWDSMTRRQKKNYIDTQGEDM